MLAADTGHALMTALLARTTHTMLQHAPTFLNILSPRQKLVARKLTDCNNYSSRTCRASDSWQSFCGEHHTGAQPRSSGKGIAPAPSPLLATATPCPPRSDTGGPTKPADQTDPSDIPIDSAAHQPPPDPALRPGSHHREQDHCPVRQDEYTQ